MTDHLTELEIYEYATGEPDPRAVDHAESCERCAAEVTRTRRLIESLERLAAVAEAPTGLDARLTRRLDALGAREDGGSGRLRAGGLRTGALRVAAAVLLFAGGAATHAAWTSASSGSPDPTAPPPALMVQRAGTDYVAAIAKLVADSGRLSVQQRRDGREVALAAMSGAAFELGLLTPEAGEATVELRRAVERARRAPAGEGRGP